MFIQIEGIDGVGKTTQCILLRDWLNAKNIKAIIVKELESTDFGRKAKKILCQTNKNSTTAEMFLFLASKSQSFSEIIIPALMRGEYIIGDRGGGSFISYNLALGVNRDLLTNLLNIATCGVVPDLTILIDLPIEAIQARLAQKVQKSRFDSINPFQLKRQKKHFLELAHILPNWAMVDGTSTKDIIHQQIIQTIQQMRG